MRYPTFFFLLAAVAFAAAPATASQAETTVERAEARFVPWSGYWWPLSAGGLNGPLGQYDRATGARALAWQKEHRPTRPDAPRWHGYCHAWAASCVMEPEPVRPVRVTAQGGGSLTLSVGDQKGMLAACHTNNVANVYGQRTEEGDQPDGDLAPDALWRLLKLYVEQQGVPLVLDLEPGSEVWNHPVYAYEVRYARPDASGTSHARMTLWLADDNVPPDYVGTRVRRQDYTFSFRMRGGSVVLGSGQWTGRSRQDHPDFAWYPYVARAENPQVQHSVVQQLVSRRDAAPPVADRPQPPAPPEPAEPTRPEEPPAQPEQPEETPTVPQQPPAAARPLLLSPMQLVALVTDRTSSFGFDITVDRFDGAHYRPGETFSVRGSSERAGYLYLLHIDAEGELTLLYPLAGQDNRIPAQKPFLLPAETDRFAFRVLPPAGLNRVKAVVTTRPLALSGLTAVPVQQQSPAQQQAPIRQQQTPVQQEAPVQRQSQVQQSPAQRQAPVQRQQPVQQQTPVQQQAPVQREAPVHQQAPSSQLPTPSSQPPNSQPPSVRQYFRWHPAQRRQIRAVLVEYLQTERVDRRQLELADPQELLGAFAQDEVMFYVEPQPAETERQPATRQQQAQQPAQQEPVQQPRPLQQPSQK